MAVAEDVDKIVRYEAGEMTEDEMFEFFQGLINTGLAWKLPPKYGRKADDLIHFGFCVSPSAN